MSRTDKGSKPPGWEPWSNRHEKAEQKADYSEHDRQDLDNLDEWYAREFAIAIDCANFGPCPACLAATVAEATANVG